WRKAQGRRLVLLTTAGERHYCDFDYQVNDCLMFGRESSGVSDQVHESADERLTIPMVEGGRSLNVAVSAAMVAGEALRQTRSLSFGINL
ncbi:MAG: tRNA (cytidine(34)-2'-O)-methyltransferase, partial [Rhizobiaceae bacterium]